MIEQIGTSLIYLAGILWTIELIPQIIRTRALKNSNGVSLLFFGIMFSAYIIYMIGNGMLGNWNIVFAHIPSMLLITYMLRLILKYRNN